MPGRALRLGLLACGVLLLAVPASFIGRVRMAGVRLLEPLITAFGRPGDAGDEGGALARRLRSTEKELAIVRRRLVAEEDRSSRLAKELKKLSAHPGEIEISERDTIPARVISRSTNWQLKTLVVDKGSSDGVSEGAGVAWASAVVGVVTELGSKASRVALLTEPGVRVASCVARTGKLGMCEGAGSYARLRYVPFVAGEEEAVREKDVVITSGSAGLFPRGLFVGTVSAASPEPNSVFFNVRVAPEVEFAEVERVLILRPAAPELGSSR